MSLFTVQLHVISKVSLCRWEREKVAKTKVALTKIS